VYKKRRRKQEQRKIYTTEGANFYIDYIREKETAPRCSLALHPRMNQTASQRERARARKGIKRKRGS
jgi:hypothetical protein